MSELRGPVTPRVDDLNASKKANLNMAAIKADLAAIPDAATRRLLKRLYRIVLGKDTE